MTTDPTWTTERIEILTRMRADGYSASQIGQWLGLTRCAVLGKAQRLGLVKANNKSHPGTKRPRPKRPRQPKPKRHHRFKLPKFTKTPLPPDGTPPAWAKPLLELQPNDCRFPYGEDDFLFCAAPAAPGHSYCESHCRTCYGRQPSERVQGRMSRLGHWAARAAG